MVAESKQQIRETSLELLSSDTINDPMGRLTQRAMFWRPAYLESSAWIEHIPFAFWLVEAHHPRVFVELGAHHGVSYFAFCQAVEKLELDARCFAVDTWKGDAQAGFYDERVFEKIKAYNEAQYSGFSRLVRSTFDDALSYFSDGSIDLLHIDGLHTFEAASHDFESWLPKLSERAVVVMHDTNVRERKFGVFKLFESLRERYSAFEFIHGHGLGVLKVGPIQTDKMLRLFRSAEKDQTKHAVQEAFARLGLACADSFSAAQQKTRAHNLKDQADKQKKQLEEVKQSQEKNKTDLHKRTKELADSKIQMQTQNEQHAVERGQLEERVTQLQETDDEQRGEIKSLEVRLAEAERELAVAQQAQAAESARHKNDVSSREAEVERLTETIFILRKKLDLSQSELGGRNEIVERLEEKLATQAAEMEGLQQDLESRLEEIGQERWYLGERDAEIGRLTEILAVRDQELDQAKNNLSERNEVAERLQEAQAAEMERLQQDLESRSEEIMRERWYLGESDAEIYRLTDTLAAREQELERAQNVLSERSEAAERLQQALDEHLAGARTLNAVLAEKSEENDSLTQRLSIRDAALKDARQALQVQEREFAELKQLYEGRSLELTATNKRLSEALAKQRALTQELAELGKKNASLTRRLSEREVTLEATQASLQEREKELPLLRKKLEERTSTMNRIEQKVKDKEQELGKLRARVNDRFRELATLTKMLEKNEGELAEKKKHATAQEEQVKQMDAALQAKDLALKVQRQRVAKLKQTVSWKITAPVRALSRPFRKASKKTKPIEEQVELIKSSGLFDEAWYLKEYPDVAENGGDAVLHYVQYGATEGRNPSPGFDTQLYLAAYTDVAKAGINPLLHYTEFGKDEGLAV